MTWLGALNFLVLQWFGIRLFTWRNLFMENQQGLRFGLYVGVVPLTGWVFGYLGPCYCVRFVLVSLRDGEV